MKILLIFGTRPEAIKIAPVVHELRRRAAAGADIDLRICSTGQHREMLRALYGHFEFQPDIDLDIMEPDQTLAGFASRAIQALDGVLADAAWTPDLVLVHGDTSTTLCAALAAYYRKIPVGHIEAGLRTGDIHAPFPEEVNRRVVSQIAAYNFAPTSGARDNLERTPLCRGQRVWVTGNTVIDALLWTVDKLRAAPPDCPLLARVDRWRAEHPDGKLILITGHRREKFGAPFESFCRGLAAIARLHPETLLVYPVHLNPNVQRPVRRILSGAPTIWLEAPMDYPSFVALMDRAWLVVTDSGGIQEEAPSLGKPVLLTRDVTERPEAIAAGTVAIVGTDTEKIVSTAHRLLTDPGVYAAMAGAINPYGDGHAARRIADAILGLPVDEFSPGKGEQPGRRGTHKTHGPDGSNGI